MPLLHGKKNIGHNIEVEEAHGKPHKQAVAIALHKAGVGRSKDGYDLSQILRHLGLRLDEWSALSNAQQERLLKKAVKEMQRGKDELPLAVKPVPLVPLPSGEKNEERYAPRPVGDGHATEAEARLNCSRAERAIRRGILSEGKTYAKRAVQQAKQLGHTAILARAEELLARAEAAAKGKDVMAGITPKCRGFKADDTGRRCKRCGRPRSAHFVAKDATPPTEPTEALNYAIKREIAGDKRRALDAYRLAASKLQGTARQQAMDGIVACNSNRHVDRYAHPGQGRVRVCDSAAVALRTALERTRAGERVRIGDDGVTVEPAEDALTAQETAELKELRTAPKLTNIEAARKRILEDKQRAEDGISSRMFKDKAAADKYIAQLEERGIEAALTPTEEDWEVSWQNGDTTKTVNDGAVMVKPVPDLDAERDREAMASSKDEHEGFAKLEHSLAHRKGVSDPNALAAWIGRKKYGAKGMAKKSAAGRAKDRLDVKPV